MGCRDVAGIHTIAFDDSGTGACTGATPTVVFTSAQAYDQIFVQGGFVFAEVTQSGVDRCATTGCTSPTNILTANPNDFFEYSAPTTTSIDYTLDIFPADGGMGGEIHSMGLDGKNDTVAFSTPTLIPEWIATSGSRVFWVDDQFDYTSNGDNGRVLRLRRDEHPWITGLRRRRVRNDRRRKRTCTCSRTTPSLADELVLACSVHDRVRRTLRERSSARSTFPPRPAQLASDGTDFYIARSNHQDIVRVDGTAARRKSSRRKTSSRSRSTRPPEISTTATSTGVLGRVKTDGSAPTTLACNQSTVTAMARRRAEHLFPRRRDDRERLQAPEVSAFSLLADAADDAAIVRRVALLPRPRAALHSSHACAHSSAHAAPGGREAPASRWVVGGVTVAVIAGSGWVRALPRPTRPSLRGGANAFVGVGAVSLPDSPTSPGAACIIASSVGKSGT